MMLTLAPMLVVAAAVIAAQPAVMLQQTDASNFAIVYNNINPSNFTWKAQTSPDLVRWTDWPQTNSGELVVKLNPATTFIRVVGTPQ